MKLDGDLAAAIRAAVDIVNAEVDSGPTGAACQFRAILERHGYELSVDGAPVVADVIDALPALERLLRSQPDDLPARINAVLRRLAALPVLHANQRGRW